MQLSKAGSVDPGGLIQALQLSDQYQQDAPEFHSLFMSLLESSFSLVGQSAIQDLFEGSCIYETQCKTCNFVSETPSKFLELDVKVAADSLENLIKNYLDEEELAGENQYACPRCACNRDGRRRTRLTATPRMLCVQLLRYVYHASSQTRTKQLVPVRLPARLDMTPFVGPTAAVAADHGSGGGTPELESPRGGGGGRSRRSGGGRGKAVRRRRPRRWLYRLSGVLLHLGKQSTAGHYVAVVRCPGREPGAEDFWKVCNDETVFAVPEGELDLSKVNAGALSPTHFRTRATVLTPKKPSGSKSSSTDSDQSEGKKRQCNKVYTSNSAYMLFYRLIDEGEAEEGEAGEDGEGESSPETSGKTNGHAGENSNAVAMKPTSNGTAKEVVVPEHLRKIVEALNGALQVENKAKEAKKKADEEEEASRVSQRSKMLQLLSTKGSGKTVPPRKRQKRSPSSSSNDRSGSDLATAIDVDAVAGDVDENEHEDDLEAAKADVESVYIVHKKWLQAWLAHPELPLPQITLPNSGTAQGVFVNARVDLESDQTITCSHGHVSPENLLQNIRAISRRGLRQCLRMRRDPVMGWVSWEEGEEERPLFTCPEAEEVLKPCLQCLRLKQRIDQFSETCGIINKEMVAWRRQSKGGALPNESTRNDKAFTSNELFLVGPNSFETWRDFAQHFFFSFLAESAPPPEAETDFNADALCPHGRLLAEGLRCVPAGLWQQLAGLYAPLAIPTFPLAGARMEPCVQCEAIKAKLAEKALGERELLAKIIDSDVERNKEELLKDVWTGGSRVDRAIYLVPMDFVQEWRKFQKLPDFVEPPSRLPSALELDGVLCPHNMLSRPADEMISDETLFPLSAKEWHHFSEAYSTTDDPPHLRWIPYAEPLSDDEKGDGKDDDDNNNNNTSTTNDTIICRLVIEGLKICGTCYEEEKLRRADFKNARIFVCQTNSAEDAFQLDAHEDRSSERGRATEAEGGPRRSMRRRVVQTDLVLRMNGTDTVQDLCVELIGPLGATPIDMNIVFKGDVLHDKSATLVQAGIQPGSRLFVWVDEPEIDIINSPKKGGLLTSPAMTKAAEEEKGFKGTRLLNNWNQGLPGE